MGRILVIKDDLTVQKALQHTFESVGYTVTLCDGTNGIEESKIRAVRLAGGLELRSSGRLLKSVQLEVVCHLEGYGYSPLWRGL